MRQLRQGEDHILTLTDNQFTIRSASPGFAEILHRPVDSLIGTDWRYLLVQQDVGIAVERAGRAMQTQKPTELVRRYVRPNGLSVLARSQLIPTLGKSGTPVLMTSTKIEYVQQEGQVIKRDSLEYIADMILSLIRMAEQGGFPSVAANLDHVLSQSRQMLAWLDADRMNEPRVGETRQDT